jgi:histidinol-phosphate phosphatase family protein
MRPAVFLDRDGTVIAHEHHLADASRVRVLPEAATGIRRLRSAGFLAVVVTNQSVIGRGLLDEPGLARIHETMRQQLASFGAAVDAIHWCGHAPTTEDEEHSEHPDRKPAPGMLLRAAAELDIDLGASWMIGDSLRDVLAGRRAGCRESILVLSGPAAVRFQRHEAVTLVAEHVGRAAEIILAAKSGPANHHPRTSGLMR